MGVSEFKMALVFLAALVMLTSAATVWLALTRPGRESDPDAAFWYAFTGLCVLAPMVLAPAMTSKASSVLLLVLAAVCALVTHHACQRRRIRTLAHVASVQSLETLAAIGRTHEILRRRWIQYELDPAANIDFPAMRDVRVPETSALIRAVQTAAQLEQTLQAAVAVPLDDGVNEYRCAVARLAQALEAAERAAGCPAATNNQAV